LTRTSNTDANATRLQFCHTFGNALTVSVAILPTVWRKTRF
jgi:hypothetical protein